MSRSHRSTTGSTGTPGPRTVDQIAQEQGILTPQDLSELIGGGSDLWESDADFDEFVAGINRRRKEGLAMDLAKIAKENRS